MTNGVMSQQSLRNVCFCWESALSDDLALKGIIGVYPIEKIGQSLIYIER
jgi:hypothetical protein